MYDLAIIGGGPAGVSAGVYAARKKLKTIFITESFGGQSTDSLGIENWIGTINISGPELGQALETHLRAFAEGIVDIKLSKADQITKMENGFQIKDRGDTYEAKAVLLCTGSSRRKLLVPGAKEFENKGITYCASCDGPLFSGQDVVVVGGGNAAFETAAQLLAYCKSVTLINRSDTFKADEMTVEKVLSHPNMRAIKNAQIKEVRGDKFVNSLVYLDSQTDEEKVLSVTGIFVEIGLLPATELVKGLVELNEYNQIVVDPRTQRTNVDGIWAAGDATDGIYHQNNIASGDAVKALENIYMYLRAESR
ncbi:MAG: FAD-dependent oxidoreductase [Parcubacteria group bacterium]